MKLFTRIAIAILISTIVPILLLFLVINGRITYEANIFIMLATGLAMLSWIYSSIVRPLEKLRKATEHIKNGNLEFTLDVDTDDEIGELTADFEDMRNKFGIEILKEQRGPKTYYHVGKREFELAEVKLLVDAIQSSKFITRTKSRELIEKVKRFVSEYQGKTLHEIWQTIAAKGILSILLSTCLLPPLFSQMRTQLPEL